MSTCNCSYCSYATTDRKDTQNVSVRRPRMHRLRSLLWILVRCSLASLPFSSSFYLSTLKVERFRKPDPHHPDPQHPDPQQLEHLHLRYKYRQSTPRLWFSEEAEFTSTGQAQCGETNQTLAGRTSTSQNQIKVVKRNGKVLSQDEETLRDIEEKDRREYSEKVKKETSEPTLPTSRFAGSTLGDIMSRGLTTTTTSDSVPDKVQTRDSDTASTSSLSQRFGIVHPLDRMALTANGNLQRLVSSYYDAPVSVQVDLCECRQVYESTPRASASASVSTSSADTIASTSTSSTVWDRVVRLTVFEETFCTATSVISVHDSFCQELVQSGQVGLGQLFRYLDVLPEFQLLQAGRLRNNEIFHSDSTTSSTNRSTSSIESQGEGGGGFWRLYRLQCAELTCEIHEEFVPNMWKLRPSILPNTDM